MKASKPGVRSVGPFRTAEIERRWELICVSEGMGNVLVQTYFESRGETEADAVDGMLRVSGFYDACYLIERHDAVLTEVRLCVERKRPLRFATLSAQADRSKRALERLRKLLKFSSPQETSAE